jgi:hypothetical protein
VARLRSVKRLHVLIEAIYKADAKKCGDNAPEELALARAFVPAAPGKSTGNL